MLMNGSDAYICLPNSPGDGWVIIDTSKEFHTGWRKVR
jgi:hypothetical protein